MEFDMDRFMKELESATRAPGGKDGGSDVDAEEGSSSDMDFGIFYQDIYLLARSISNSGTPNCPLRS